MEETYYTNVDHTDPALPSFSQGAEMPLPTLFGAPPVPVGTTRSALMEEAFRKAQEASYTAGYWTAIYQMHASQKVCDLILVYLFGFNLISGSTYCARCKGRGTWVGRRCDGEGFRRGE